MRHSTGHHTQHSVSSSSAEECVRCHATGPRRVHLEHMTTGDRIMLCPRCLRSSRRLQADVGDAHARYFLTEYADEHAWGVWRSEHVAYVLPQVDHDHRPERPPFALHGLAQV